ncbi:MAG: isoprenylcysteine carboxylmethyltransferase family protein [Anaerolineae bacterium]
MNDRALPLLVLIPMLFFIVVVPCLPLLISGRWDWWEGWTYAIIAILGFAISRALAARQHPDLLAERARFLRNENPEPWDRLLAPLVALGSGLLPLVAGLDARFGWSPTLSLPVKIVALMIILGGYVVASYALVANRYFSGMVRMQDDRGHRVVSSGPYRWIRHPGYAGAIVTYLATPVLLDALWAYVPALSLTIVVLIRTALEDRTLQERLEGYRDYAGKVRYRLLPGVW